MTDSSAAPLSAGPGPDLSVIVVVSPGAATMHRVLECLRAQTIRDRIELVIVDMQETPLPDGFFGVTTVATAPEHTPETRLAAGIRAATAPVLALLEDHAFPEPRWAESLLKAHRGSWSVVGAVAMNANPDSLLSWTNFLLSYGKWSEPAKWGETQEVSVHNMSIKRAALADLDGDLAGMFSREGGLLPRLRACGHRFYLEPGARYHHANPSLLSSTAELRFNAGRLYGARRSALGQWSVGRRLMYVAGAPLIPFVRLARLHRELFAAGRHRDLVPRVFPALLLGLALDAAGQMVGYLTGAGRSERTLAAFEADRVRHLTRRDRLRLAGTA